MKNSVESKNCLKQVAQSLDQISNNMLDESHDEILQQMCDKMAEVLKAIESGNRMVVSFASAKSLAEELMQTHAKQPKQRFTGMGAQRYKCSAAQISMRTQIIELSTSSLNIEKSYKKL